MWVSSKRNISSLKIIELYRNGERDFSNVLCSGADFPKAVLKGCNFSRSNLSFCTFDDADLSECDFTGANLEWSSFERCDLRKTNLTKTNLSWSVLNRAKMDGAVTEKTNLTWCLLFEVSMKEEQKKKADIRYSAFNISEVTAEGRAAVMRNLAKRRGYLPFDVFLETEFIVKSGNELLERLSNINADQKMQHYELKVGFGYASAGNVYEISAGEGNYNRGSGVYSLMTKKDSRTYLDKE